MKRGQGKIVLFVLVVWFFMVITVTSQAEVTYKAAAGQIGGGWYTILSGLAEIINKHQKGHIRIVVVPGSGVSNIATCSMGETPVTMSFPPFIIAAQKGEDPYDKKYPDTMVIASGFGSSAQHLVTTRRDLTAYDQISKNKVPIKLTINRPGATDEFIFRKVMTFYKFSYDDIKKWGGKIFFVGHGEAAQLMKDGHGDTHFSYIAVPGSSIVEMAMARDVTFVSIPKDLMSFLESEWSLFRETIPKGTYKGQKEDILSLAMSNTLMVNAKVDNDTVYRMTKAICENVKDVRSIYKGCEDWSPTQAVKGVEPLLHPGAFRYYKEKGYIK